MNPKIPPKEFETAPKIVPKNPWKARPVDCSVKRIYTPFLNDETKAHGDMLKWVKIFKTILLIGYGNYFHGKLQTWGFYKFMVVSKEKFFVCTYKLTLIRGRYNLDINNFDLSILELELFSELYKSFSEEIASYFNKF